MDAGQFRTYMKPDPRPGTMTEAELQDQVQLMCRQLGLYCYHTHDSRRSQAGWPDLVIISERTKRAVFRELKSQTGRLTSDQKYVGYLLAMCGLSWEVWRPADLFDGTIATQLAQLAGHQIRRTG